LTFQEHLEEMRAEDPLFRDLWDSGQALDGVLNRYLDSWMACDRAMALTPVERGVLIYEIHNAVNDIFWFREQGHGFKVIRQKRLPAEG
jgi:hypothetical protein